MIFFNQLFQKGNDILEITFINDINSFNDRSIINLNSKFVSDIECK